MPSRETNAAEKRLGRGSFKRGFYLLADPKVSLASFSSIFLGIMAALAQGSISVGWFILTVTGIFAVEVAKNASGEVFDFDSGTDLAVKPEQRTPFSGGKRVLVEQILTRSQTWWIAGGAYATSIVVGLIIVLLREPTVLWLGLVGMGLAFFYHARPLALSYRGLGEVAVAFCYGPLICAGTFLVQQVRGWKGT